MANRRRKAKQKRRMTEAELQAQRKAEQQARAASRKKADESRRTTYREERAPAFDYDDGHTPPAQRQAAQKASQRRKKEHVRITKAEMKRRRLRRRLITGALLLAAVAAGLVLSVTLLFRVTGYEFQTADGQPGGDTGTYTKEQIISTLGVAQGDNLFGFRTEEKEAVLDAAFPLLESIELRRRLPDTVILRVEPAEESYCIQTNTGWLVLSRHRKVMAMAGSQPALPVLRGAVMVVPQVGQTLTLGTAIEDDKTGESLPSEEEKILTELLALLEQYGILQDVTEIDLTETENLFFGYQSRIRVNLGTVNSLDYKVKFAAHLLKNESGDGLAAADAGVLDASIIRDDGTIRPTFAQGDAGLIVPGQPAPEATAAPDADSAQPDAAPEA